MENDEYHISGGEIFNKEGIIYDIGTIIDILNSNEKLIAIMKADIDLFKNIMIKDNEIIHLLNERIKLTPSKPLS